MHAYSDSCSLVSGLRETIADRTSERDFARADRDIYKARFITDCRAATDVLNELYLAESKFPPMHSAHEGYAILAEETAELWVEVRAKPDPDRDRRMRAEAVQVGAMALRFIRDVCDKGKG